ncbi:MAG: DUF86 domain-containing protein [Deltaproteobacteria bacterium]|nr:DUF86 domain-containing protein [Deltaproteobacteria bacterium]
MRKDDIVRLKHMLDAAKEARSFASNKKRSDLDANRQLTLALLKDIEIIGEAASKVSEETKAKYPSMPWLDIINMRNRLIHAYFDIDLEIVWDTVTKDIPPLIAELEKIVG